jgi:hypothetical protein
VQRLSPLGQVAPWAAGLLLAACLASGQVRAQTALVNPDPFAPTFESNPKEPPRFEKSKRQRPERLGQPTTFSQVFPPPPSGAGTTGFDASNSPDRNSKAGTRSTTTTTARAPELSPAPALPPPGVAQTPEPTPSPYDLPQIPEQAPSAEEANGAYAELPEGAPVPEIGPIRKKPKRKAHEEPEDPYAPLGIHAGAFYLYPTLELIGGYDTNPGQLQQPKAAWSYTTRGELKVQSDWSRHELKADLSGGYTGYTPEQTPELSRPYFNGTVDGRVDVRHDTRIDLQARGLISTDNPSNPNLQAGLAKLPLYVDYGGTAGVGQQFGRLDLSIKGDADRIAYQDSLLTDGSTASNEDRNYDQYGGRFRAGYELSPGVVPFGEVDIDTRKHDLAADFYGYQRDSDGVTGKAGTTFKLRGTLSGEIAVGYTTRHYEDPRLPDIDGLVGDASLIWTASALTTVKLTGRSTVGESTIPGVSGVLYRDVGLQVDHAFRRWLIGTVKAGYGNDDYIGMSRDDDRYSLGVALTYKFNRMLQLTGEIDQYWLRSNQPGNNYSETLFLLGLKLQR